MFGERYAPKLDKEARGAAKALGSTPLQNATSGAGSFLVTARGLIAKKFNLFLKSSD